MWFLISLIDHLDVLLQLRQHPFRHRARFPDLQRVQREPNSFPHTSTLDQNDPLRSSEFSVRSVTEISLETLDHQVLQLGEQSLSNTAGDHFCSDKKWKQRTFVVPFSGDKLWPGTARGFFLGLPGCPVQTCCSL
jgi:hypothetical protein